MSVYRVSLSVEVEADDGEDAANKGYAAILRVDEDDDAVCVEVEAPDGDILIYRLTVDGE